MSDAAAAAPPRRRSWIRRHRRAVDATVVVIAIVLIAEVVARVLAPGLLPPRSDAAGETSVKKALMTERGPTAIAFTGGSALDAALIPELVSQRSGGLPTGFNAAVLGSRLASQDLWLANQVLPRLQPRLVVHEVNPLAVLPADDTGYGEAALEATVVANIQALDDDLATRLQDRLADASALVRYRGSLRDPVQVRDAVQRRLDGSDDLLMAVRPESYWEQAITSTGHVTQYGLGQMDPKMPAGLVSALQGFLGGTVRMQKLDAIFDRLDAEGVVTVALIPPFARSVMASNGLDVARLEEVTQTIREHLAERGIPVIDLSLVPVPDSSFFDPIHVNQRGAEQLSLLVGDELQALCRSGRVACP